MAKLHQIADRESVRKHVAAIHVGGKLSLLQRKLSNCLLLNAYDDLLRRPSHRIDAQTLSTMAGYDSNDQKTLREALKALAETTAEWDMLDDDGERQWGVSSLISYATLKAGICEYAYAPPLAEKLHDPAVFAIINMKVQRNFTSGHALALYENCYRFVRVGSTGWWDIETFRRLMGLHDVAYYDVFSRLNAKVIKPAVAEVNKVSDIRITAETRRQSRAISHVRFLIQRNRQETLFDLGDDEGVRKSPVFERLASNGISERLARQWISEHGEDYVSEKLDFIERERARGRVRKTPQAYLSAAISGDFKSRGAGQGASPARPEPSPADYADRFDHERRTDERERRTACIDLIHKSIANHGPARQKADRDRFRASLRDEEARSQFDRFGWNAGLLFAQVEAFWRERLPEMPER